MSQSCTQPLIACYIQEIGFDILTPNGPLLVIILCSFYLRSNWFGEELKKGMGGRVNQN